VISLDKYKVIIFDMDGTLTEAFKTTILPHRTEHMIQLRGQGKTIAVVTNQAGPLWREATGRIKYPRAAAIAENIYIVSTGLNFLEEHWFVSTSDFRARDLFGDESDYQAALIRIEQEFADVIDADLIHVSSEPTWRKPGPGMLLAAASQLNVELPQCLMVGDRSEDAEAAAAAGIDFVDSSQFFEDHELKEPDEHPF
jgi:phosphoglycolate phosphatase-like HAD superfamily hydrolase